MGYQNNNDTIFNVGTGGEMVIKAADSCYMSYNSGTTTQINVTGGGTLDIYATYLGINLSANTKTKINVEGDGSRMTIHEKISPDSSANTFSLFGNVSSDTSISVGSGGLLQLKGTNQFGLSSGAAKVAIDVKKGGKLESKNDAGSALISMNNNTGITNHGTVNVDHLDIWGGVYNNYGETQALKINFYQNAAVLQNTGVINNAGLLEMGAVYQSGGIINCITGGRIKANLPTSLTLGFKVSNLNRTQPCQTLLAGSTYSPASAFTIILSTEENLPAGKYKLLDATAATATRTGSTENMTVCGLGAAADDVYWESGTLYFLLGQNYVVRRAPEADALLGSAWGSFKSAQAFTGTLRLPKGNAKSISKAPDGKDGMYATPSAKTIVWATGYSHFSRLCSAGAASGADYNLQGGAMGIERLYATGQSVGAALGYDWGRVSPFSTARVKQESLHAALYGRAIRQRLGNGFWALDAAASIGSTESSHRGLQGDWQQEHILLETRASYICPITSNTAASAFAGAQYYAADADKAKGMELSSMQNLRFMLGGGISRNIGKATIFGELSLHYDALRDNPNATVNEIDFGTGAKPGRTGGSISVGGTYQLSDDWSLRGSYTYEHADNQHSHSVNFGAVYSF